MSEPRKSYEPATVVVVGMHRSGTSLVSRMLEGCGVHFGASEDLAGPAEDNTQGFWEHTGIRTINEELLERLDATWRSPPASSEGRPEDTSNDDLRERAREILGELKTASPLCGWKDPRTSLVLPFWRSLVADDFRPVLCVRHPLAVAASLNQRNGIPAALALFLWQEYCARAVSGLADLPVVVISYEEVLRDPRGQATRLAAALRLPAHTADVETMAAAVEPHLSHHPQAAAKGWGAWAGGEDLFVQLSECAADVRPWADVQPMFPPRNDVFVALMRDSGNLASRLSTLENVYRHRDREAVSIQESASALRDEIRTSQVAFDRERELLRQESSTARQELRDTRQELSRTQGNLTAMHEALRAAREELCATGDQLSATSRKLSATREELTSTRDALERARAQLEANLAHTRDADEQRRQALERASQLSQRLGQVLQSKGWRRLEQLRSWRRLFSRAARP